MLCLVAQLCLTLCDPTDCSPPGFSVHGDSPGKNTGVDCHALLQGIFLIQGSNPDLSNCRQILYRLSYQGSPRILEEVAYPFSSGSSQPRHQTRVSCIAGGFFTNWAMREAHTYFFKIFPKSISYSQRRVFLGIGSALSLLAVEFLSILLYKPKYFFFTLEWIFPISSVLNFEVHILSLCILSEFCKMCLYLPP